MRANQFKDNPFPAGTMAAANWDARESLRRLARAQSNTREGRWVAAMTKRVNAWLARRGL